MPKTEKRFSPCENASSRSPIMLVGSCCQVQTKVTHITGSLEQWVSVEVDCQSNPRPPSLDIVPTLGLEVCKWDLLRAT